VRGKGVSLEMNLLFNLFNSVLSKVALRSRYLQFRGSFIVYIIMKSIAKFYKVLFFAYDGIVVPTVWGARFRPLKNNSFAENRYLSLMLGIIEPRWEDYFDRYIVESRVFLDIVTASDGYYTVRACKLNPRIKSVAVEPYGTDKFYLSLFGMVSGHDARHRCGAGLIHQALQTSQVLSFRETLFCDSVHCRIESKGSLREAMSHRCIQGICENMGSQVLIFVQTIKES
jgi:hypothetical protein